MSLILGIDEVGRGAWAGPLVVGAVVFDQARTISGLKDSKKLTVRRRETLLRQIQNQSIGIGVGWVDAKLLDEIGLSASLHLATQRAFQQIPTRIRHQIDRIIIDGTIRLLDDERVTTMIQADDKIQAVSAASIAAKVARDNYMKRLVGVFPDYDFASHVGYGTAKHRLELENFGVINGIHRQSFAPIALALGKSPPPQTDRISATIGRRAEIAAADYLTQLGHEIIDRNWRNKFCEIDILSVHDGTLYFHEVKHRSRIDRGDGLAAITPKKLKQMRFAAEIFLASNPGIYGNHNLQIAAISVSGQPPKVDQFIKEVF